MEMLWEGEEEEAGMMLDEAPSAPSASMLELEEDAILPEAEGVDITSGAVLKKIETLVGSLLAALVEPTPTVPPLKLQTSAATTLERRLLNVREAPQCVRLWRVLAEAHRCVPSLKAHPSTHLLAATSLLAAPSRSASCTTRSLTE